VPCFSPGKRAGVLWLLLFAQGCPAEIEVLLAPIPFLHSESSGDHFQDPLGAVSTTYADWLLYAAKKVAFGR